MAITRAGAIAAAAKAVSKSRENEKRRKSAARKRKWRERQSAERRSEIRQTDRTGHVEGRACLLEERQSEIRQTDRTGHAEARARLSEERHEERRAHHDMEVVDEEKDSCDNCHRRDFSVDPRYKLTFTVVSNEEIRTCKLAKVKPRRVDDQVIFFTLCQECERCLKKTPDYSSMTSSQKAHMFDWKNIWPSFLWDILSGCNASDNVPYHQIEGAETLWRMICASMREYWFEAIGIIQYRYRGNIIKPYDGCTLDQPKPFFVDRTMDVDKFWNNIHSLDMKRMLVELNSEKTSLIPDVLCPWGCTEFCFEAGHTNLGILIQHHLRKVVLNFPTAQWYRKMHLVESSRNDYICEEENRDLVLMNPKWPVQPCVVLEEGEGLMAMVCRHHMKHSDTKRLYLHPPRKPNNILSSERSDQLCPCQAQPRTVGNMKASKYNTTMMMTSQQYTFSGADSFYLTSEPQFSSLSVMLMTHETQSIAKRNDINSLISQFVRDGMMNAELAKNLRERAAEDYPEGSLQKYIESATYVNLRDCMLFQKKGRDESVDVVVRRSVGFGRYREEVTTCRCSWLPTINAIQVEDSNGHGYPFTPVENYKSTGKGEPAMMLWVLIGAIMGCKDLYEAIAEKRLPFRYDGWEGHFLTHLCLKYAKYADVNVKSSSGSPFKASQNNTVEKLLDRIKKFMPQDMLEFEGSSFEDRNLFFRFNIAYLRELFQVADYPSIDIVSSIEYAVSSIGKDIIIVVETELQDISHKIEDFVSIGHIVFEARVVIAIDAEANETCRPGAFTGVRWARHGTGFCKYWKQTRSSKSSEVMTHHSADDIRIAGTVYALLTVYVRVQDSQTSRYKLDFFHSLGGQTHVFCSCNTFPLIISGRLRKDKRLCMQAGCTGKERFVCSNNSCNTRICRQCFDGLPMRVATTLSPVPEATEISERSSVPAAFPSLPNNAVPSQGGHGELDIAIETFSDCDRGQLSDEGNDDDLGLRDILVNRLQDNEFNDMDNDGYILGDYLTNAHYDIQDMPACDIFDCREEEQLPTTDAGNVALSMVSRVNELHSVPIHVLLNQVGNLCNRYNHRITGTSPQQNWVQRFVARQCGVSYPFIYPMGTLFPRHFYSQATNDMCAILGDAPLFTYSHITHPFGFASNLQRARCLLTSASSSASTCPLTCAYLYDVQSNGVMSNIDSRLAERNGFVVDLLSPHGMSVRDKDRTNLSEGLDSRQAALNLAGAQPYVKFDLFLTFTCNQKCHPGVKHLHEWKEGMEWSKYIPRYSRMTIMQHNEIKRSFELAYGAILGRVWYEVRRIFLKYLTYSKTSVLRKVRHAFWRDEYQDDVGNLPHIHGMIALDKDTMSDKEVINFVCGLIRSNVASLFSTRELDRYVELGIFNKKHDWFEMTELAERILPHKCSKRCMIRISDGGGPECFQCKKPHPTAGRRDPLEDEFRETKFSLSPECMATLERIGVYKPPVDEAMKGTFQNELFRPTRHFGRCDPKAKENMSPVIPELFGATQSMQNAQVMTTTNGVARYVVGYVTQRDQNNRVTVAPSVHNSANMQVDTKFLHNTKITRSRINEDKAHQKSNRKHQPCGRAVSFPEMQQKLLGQNEVMTTLAFVHINTMPFEQRQTTVVKLDSKGALRRPHESNNDVQSSVSTSELVRQRKNFPEERQLTSSQRLLYRNNGAKTIGYDMVTQFGLRPVELLELFSTLGNYFRWFHIDAAPLPVTIMENLLSAEIRICCWIDCLGRRLRLRREAFDEVKAYLDSIDTLSIVHVHSDVLRVLILAFIVNDGDRDSIFVFEDGGKDLPIPIYSSLTPHSSVAFILHIMLVCGSFETELDLIRTSSLRESLIVAKLIGIETDNLSLQMYSNKLMLHVINDILPSQPASMRCIDGYLVAAKNLFDGVLFSNDIPVTELPPCLLTELLCNKDLVLQASWDVRKENQLRSIYSTLPSCEFVPSQEAIRGCTREAPTTWFVSPFDAYVQFEGQSDQSYMEQKLAVQIGIRSIDKYLQQLGPRAATQTKNLLIHGVPGSGKSYVAQYLNLYAISKGLRLVPTSIMGVRATNLGGEHMHRLFGLSTKKNANVSRMAELAIDKLNRKSQLCYLHTLLTIDVLLFDEFGQASAEQVKTLDILLRKVRNSNIPFGGVLFISTVDPAQFGPIKGLPLFLSSHILTDFVIVGLYTSVRAQGDALFCELQNISRMKPSLLIGNGKIEARFKHLLRTCLTFVRTWDEVAPDVQRMYAKCKPAQEASIEYVDSCQHQFDINGTPYRMSISEDYQKPVGSRAEMKRATSLKLIHRINSKVKEPPKLIMFRWAQYEATVNGVGYGQSQLLVMSDLPTMATIMGKHPIEMLAAPSGITYLNTRNCPIDSEHLLQVGWKRVIVNCAPERNVTLQGVMGYRKQYAMRHIGSGTINKQTGNTIDGQCAIEMSEACCPWAKEQIVVMLSRTRIASDTIIVGDTKFAVDKIWNLITIGTQWTAYIDQLLDRLSVNGNDGSIHDVDTVISFPNVYPYRISDISLPSDSTGFVYMLVSVKDCSRTYVGQTENISKRLYQHNKGWGAVGTTDPQYRPYAVAAYICGMRHMNRVEREGIEKKWKIYNRAIMQESSHGRNDVMDRIEQGRRIVVEYNEDQLYEEMFIRFVITIDRSSVLP